MSYLATINRYIQEIDSCMGSLNRHTIHATIDLFKDLRDRQVGSLFFFANGGSVGIAEHCSIDYFKIGGFRTEGTLSPAFLTCLSNDFGYSVTIEKYVDRMVREADVCVFISSSGESPNIINGVMAAKGKGCKTIGLSGFNERNRLSELADLSFWVDSDKYNIIENAHQILLLYILDVIVDGALT